MKSLICTMLFFVCASPVFSDQSIGVTSIEIADGDRSLALTLWYPGEGGTQEAVGRNAVFAGVIGARDASPAAGLRPVVLVSHGGLRSAAHSGAWLGAALAEAGFLAVEIKGPRPRAAAEAIDEVWRRPNDVSVALDALLKNEDWAGRIDETKVSVVGFALGGTAALMLAGGEIATPAFVQSCDTPDGGPDCAWYTRQGVSLRAVDIEALSAPRRDDRIRSAVSIAPEYLDTLSDGLFSLDVPTLVVSLGNDNSQEGPGASDELSQAVIFDATTFDAFQACTPSGPSILAEDGGNPALCGASAEARHRAHDAILDVIIPFLTGHPGN